MPCLSSSSSSTLTPLNSTPTGSHAGRNKRLSISQSEVCMHRHTHTHTRTHAHMLMHASTHSFTHSLTHSLDRSLTPILTRSLTHTLAHSQPTIRRQQSHHCCAEAAHGSCRQPLHEHHHRGRLYSLQGEGDERSGQRRSNCNPPRSTPPFFQKLSTPNPSPFSRFPSAICIFLCLYTCNADLIATWQVHIRQSDSHVRP